MSTVLNFADLGCLNESAAGPLGAGMASFVRAGFPAVRGFVVTPLAFSEFLRKPEVAHALDMLSSSAESPEEGRRALKAVFQRSRLAWADEMDLLSAFGELDAPASLVAAARHGAASAPVYASRGEDLLDGVKHCWLRWLKANAAPLPDGELPSVVVRAVVEAEVSVELRRRGKGVRARAVFGLPEGLEDPAVSADIYEFAADGALERMETRPQEWQYSAKASGPAKVGVAPGFSDEEKMAGEMLKALAPVMEHMLSNPGMELCGVCFVSSRPVMFLAMLDSERSDVQELPHRTRSVSLLESEERPAPAPGQPSPVVAAAMFVCAEDLSEAGALADEYLEGILLAGDPLSGEGWLDRARESAAEAKRRFRSSTAVFEVRGLDRAKAERLATVAAELSGIGMQAGALIPGIRSEDELTRVVREIRSAGAAPAPQVWVRVMYPSNLFFMDSLARHSDALVLDLDSLGRLMLGATDDGKWLPFSIPALEKALEQPLRSKYGRMAAMSADLVSTPGLLEFLVRNRADILCVHPREVATVKHIVASVEKRILLEQGGA
jgi:hypothetical protein